MMAQLNALFAQQKALLTSISQPLPPPPGVDGDTSVVCTCRQQHSRPSPSCLGPTGCQCNTPACTCHHAGLRLPSALDCCVILSRREIA